MAKKQKKSKISKVNSSKGTNNQHDHGFEMMAIVAIVAVVGLIIMFMNTGNLSGEAFGGNKAPKVQVNDECADVNCAPESTHPCCTDDQVLDPCGGETSLYCTNDDGTTYPPSCTVNDRNEPTYSCFKEEK